MGGTCKWFKRYVCVSPFECKIKRKRRKNGGKCIINLPCARRHRSVPFAQCGAATRDANTKKAKNNKNMIVKLYEAIKIRRKRNKYAKMGMHTKVGRVGVRTKKRGARECVELAMKPFVPRHVSHTHSHLQPMRRKIIRGDRRVNMAIAHNLRAVK